MPKMVSGSAIARVATPPKRARRKAEPGATDYAARIEFLDATAVWQPVPLEALLALVPMYLRWHEAAVAQWAGDPLAVKVLNTMFNVMHFVPGRVTLPGSAEMLSAVREWMKRFDFRDGWIEETGWSTLWVHARGRGKPSYWYWFEPGRELHPELRFTPPTWRDGESMGAYLSHCDEEYRRARKEVRMLFQFRTGERKGQSQPAQWTAAAFKGKTFAAIARSEKTIGTKAGNAIGEDTIGKAVRAFQCRIGLTLPASVSP